MPHSTFKLTNTNLLTTGFGRLTPFYFQPVVPGDKLKLGSSFQIQLMPLLAPAFQDCRVYVHYYYVPSRVLYLDEQYNAFISREQRILYNSPVPRAKSFTAVKDIVAAYNAVYRNNGSGSVVPWISDGHAFDNLLADYLRVQLGPTNYNASIEQIIIEPFVAYLKIFIDHYASTQYPNYFISSTGVNGDYSYVALSYEDLQFLYTYLQHNGFDLYLSATVTLNLPGGQTVNPLMLLLQIQHVMYGRKGDMFMEMYPAAETTPSETFNANIESLRLANTIQKYRERKARVGHGVAEFLWEFFHVKNSDSRLKRSSFLGGGRSMLNIDDVIQTSQTYSENNEGSHRENNSAALGELGGNSWSKSAFGFGRRYFEEYGYVFGLFYVLPKQAYFQGIDQLYKYQTSDDLYLEPFDSIGDEPVFMRELVAQSAPTDNDQVIGYQPRYQRYKRVKNEIHGDFRNSLLYFHQSRVLPISPSGASIRPCFAKPQSLNRIFNYNGLATEASEQPIMVYVKNKAKWRRKMRYNCKPRL